MGVYIQEVHLISTCWLSAGYGGYVSAILYYTMLVSLALIATRLAVVASC
jgi:hypothetical protein